jgi:bacteriocin-like protein
MTNITELNTNELDLITGGVVPSTSTDPRTGETVIRDCTGGEIGRYPAGMYTIAY